jgi:hypothetical protein
MRALFVFGLSAALVAGAQARFPGGVFKTFDGNVNLSLDFDSTGTATSYVNGESFSQGKYTVKADTLSFGTLNGPEGYSCSVGGKYLWSIAENRLTMKVVADECQIRRDYLSGLVWTRG